MKRLNLNINGKRTTARFPPYLWSLSLEATGWTDEQLAQHVKSSIDQASDSIHSPSDAVANVLVRLINSGLQPVAFNRDPKKRESAKRDVL
jgi:hypothetical protein